VTRISLVDVVVKIGGSLLKSPPHFHRVLAEIAAVSRERRLLVVPGGGPFADAVRTVDRSFALPDSVSHWMAVLAMDQCAHLIAAALTSAALIHDAAEISEAIRDGRVPVLAPYRWLSTADPLPHSWDVTSDSIAAWVAGRVGAKQLVLVKAAHAAGGAGLVDPFFRQALPAGVIPIVLTADRLSELGPRLQA